MEGYELYRLSDEEIQHVGVKGMKWGKRKSRSAYMTAVDKHEAKTKANRQKVADHKAREKEQGKAVAKAVGKKYMGAVAKHEAKTASKREAKAVKGAARKQLAKARAKDLSEKLSKGLNIAVAVNDVYGDISPTGLKNHFANAEQLEKYGIAYIREALKYAKSNKIVPEKYGKK